MPAPTREELILNLKSNPKTKGMTDAQIAAKADEILPKLIEKYGGEATVKETVKVAPKAPPKSATPAPKAPAPKPSPAVAAQVPRAVEEETVKVTTTVPRDYDPVGGGGEAEKRTDGWYYTNTGAPVDLRPPIQRGYYAPSHTIPSAKYGWSAREADLAARSAPTAAPRPALTRVMTDREIAEAAAEQGIRTGSPSSARDFMAPEPTPMLDKPAIPSYVTRYGGMGDVRKDEDEIAGMRAAMKAMKPAKAALVDAMDDADVAAAYKRLNAE